MWVINVSSQNWFLIYWKSCRLYYIRSRIECSLYENLPDCKDFLIIIDSMGLRKRGTKPLFTMCVVWVNCVYYFSYDIIICRYCQIGNAVAVSVSRALGYTLGLACRKLSGNEPLVALPPKFSHSHYLHLSDNEPANTH